MDWTRKFNVGLSRNKYGLVFVESKAWLLRVRFFQEKLAGRHIERTDWQCNFVRRTTRHDLLEVHGDSDTPWAVPGGVGTLTWPPSMGAFTSPSP